MISHTHHLPLILAVLACLVGCTPTPQPDPARLENASYHKFSTPEITSVDLDRQQVESVPHSDDWNVVRHNKDGSAEVEIVAFTQTVESRTREVVDEFGETQLQTYEVLVPSQQIHHVTVPSGVDIGDYLDERFPVVEEEPPLDFVPEVPVHDYSP